MAISLFAFSFVVASSRSCWASSLVRYLASVLSFLPAFFDFRVLATSSELALNKTALLARSDSQMVKISFAGVFIIYLSMIA
jgi:hypothetical protein